MYKLIDLKTGEETVIEPTINDDFREIEREIDLLFNELVNI